jgi:hypothetical protein
MKILYTGLNGLVGREFASLAIANSEFSSASRHFSFVRSRLPSSLNLPSRVLATCEIVGDCSSQADLNRAVSISDPDVIVHIAQIVYIGNILRAISDQGKRPVLVVVGTTGSFSKFEACSSPYLNAESDLRRSEFPYILLRPSMIYGHPCDKNMHKLVKSICFSRLALLPDGGKSMFQPVHYTDVAHALYVATLAAMSPLVPARREITIPGPDTVSLRQIVETISRQTVSSVFVIPLPLAFLGALIAFAERISAGKFFLKSEQILRLSEDKVYDSGWDLLDPSRKLVPFEKGIARLVRSYTNR